MFGISNAALSKITPLNVRFDFHNDIAPNSLSIKVGTITSTYPVVKVTIPPEYTELQYLNVAEGNTFGFRVGDFYNIKPRYLYTSLEDGGGMPGFNYVCDFMSYRTLSTSSTDRGCIVGGGSNNGLFLSDSYGSATSGGPSVPYVSISFGSSLGTTTELATATKTLLNQSIEFRYQHGLLSTNPKRFAKAVSFNEFTSIYSSSNELGVICGIVNSSSAYACGHSHRFYKFETFQGWHKTHMYIPVKRNSDNTLGVYDVCEKTFTTFRNNSSAANSNGITAGPTTTNGSYYPHVDVPVTALNTRVICTYNSRKIDVTVNDLAQKYNYTFFNRTVYNSASTIDCVYVPSFLGDLLASGTYSAKHITIEGTIARHDNFSLWDNMMSYGKGGLLALSGTYGETTFEYGYDGTQSVVRSPIEATNYKTFLASPDNCSLITISATTNGQTYSLTTKDAILNSNINTANGDWLGIQQNNIVGYYLSVYGIIFKLSYTDRDATTQLKYNFVPFFNPVSNTCGLYDTVNKKYYYNTSGSPTAPGYIR